MTELPVSLEQLAALYGVETSYEDVLKGSRRASVESLIRILRGLGAEITSLEDVPKAIQKRRAQLWQRVLEPTTVGWLGKPLMLTLRLPAAMHTGRWVTTLELENGEKRREAGTVASLPVTSSEEVDGTRYVARTLTLTAELPAGYHQIELELPKGSSHGHVIIAPEQAYVPMAMSEGRSWGAFLPLYALRGATPKPIADLADLGEWSDWLTNLGADLVGTLPILASFLDEPFAPSPYTPVSRLFWNELFLAMDDLPELKLSDKARSLMGSSAFRRASRNLHQAPLVDYKEAMTLKRQVLTELTHTLYTRGGGRREALESYLREHPTLVDYAQFMSAVEKQHSTWHAWGDAAKQGKLGEAEVDEASVRYHQYVQWAMAEQLQNLTLRTRNRGGGLYLDMPLGVHPDGYDVWRERQVFFADLAAGAPPDPLSAAGQNWGFPGLVPERLRESGYRYLAQAIRHHAQVARALRIDHVMGLHRLFLIPNGMQAKDGVYVQYPSEELYAVLALESTRHQCAIIGEDLGTVPPMVRPALSRHRVQRMYVGQFEVRDEPFRAMVPPPANALASFDTHDTATFIGYFAGADLDDQLQLGGMDAGFAVDERARRQRLRTSLVRYLHQQGYLPTGATDDQALVQAVHRELAASAASAVLVNIEDLWLESKPQNVPGTVTERPNWQRKARLDLPAIRSTADIEKLFKEIHSLRQARGVPAAEEPDVKALEPTVSDRSRTAVQDVLPHSILRDEDLHYFNEGTHARLYERLGAHPATFDGVEGTYFGVWAPDANYVSVVGDFNHWNRSGHPLKARGSSGIWEGFIPGVGHGDLYKFHIGSRFHGYQVDKADPFGRFHETPPNTASCVWRERHAWGDGDWMKRRADHNRQDQAISIYEVHLGSWMRVPEEDNRWLTYREMAPRLAAHVRELGFTHVELMPVMEHPFYGSWGYQVTGYFAPSSRYGTPDDLMFLIDTLHQAGIGVILDWVPAHFPSDQHGLGYFDGTHLYEHADSRKGFHPDWQSYIFNYGRNEVRSFLLSSAVFWLDLYHADGLRVDGVASMLYLDYSRKEGEWIPNQYGGRENLEAISLLRQMNEVTYKMFPDIVNLAEESTAWPMVSRPTYVGGLGFGFKWDMGWMHDTLAYMSRDPIHRRYHHNELTFRMLYAFTENFVLPLSHDEVVHGKGSLLAKMPGDTWQKFANLRLLYANMYAQAGKKLLFMGAEIASYNEWYHEASLDWHLLQHEPHRGVMKLLSDLNHLYRCEPAMHELDTSPDGFEWVDCTDADASVYAFLRKSKSDKSCVLVVLNMTPCPREGYRLGVPHAGAWQEILNSDGREYGGSGVGNGGAVNAEEIASHNHKQSLKLTLPPLGAVYLRHSGM